MKLSSLTISGERSSSQETMTNNMNRSFNGSYRQKLSPRFFCKVYLRAPAKDTPSLEPSNMSDLVCELGLMHAVCRRYIRRGAVNYLLRRLNNHTIFNCSVPVACSIPGSNEGPL